MEYAMLTEGKGMTKDDCENYDEVGLCRLNQVDT
jgi:hypothetical protein